LKILVRKQFSTLRPVDEAGEEVLRKLKNGSLVQVEIKQPRNVGHHRKYWALVSLVADNTDRYPDAETVHEAIKIAVGLRTEITMPDGSKGYIPGSIAFNKMDQGEFNVFFDRVCDAVAKHFLPGVTSESLKHEVEDLIGVAA
jgi:hypothetical protein